ncbi:hypothetical protein [Aureimonas pseudogalii]|uniref:hypothetical protein n=1 Tax=Aureimonas pseudogalii TaxID=1744844 RepID=UPI001606A500
MGVRSCDVLVRDPQASSNDETEDREAGDDRGGQKSTDPKKASFISVPPIRRDDEYEERNGEGEDNHRAHLVREGCYDERDGNGDSDRGAVAIMTDDPKRREGEGRNGWHVGKRALRPVESLADLLAVEEEDERRKG